MLQRFFRHIARFRHNASGAVAIEFVLIAPILLTLLFGIVVLGYYMGVSHSVSQLATGAARSSVAGLDQTERQALADQYLAEAGQRYPLLVQEAISPTVTFDGNDPEGITVAVVYALDGSLLDVANGFLGLNLETINGSAYLAY